MNRGLAPRRQVDSTRAQLRDPEVNMDKRPGDLYEGGAAGTLPTVGKWRCPNCGGSELDWPQRLRLGLPGRCVACGVLVEREILRPGRFERLVADLVRKLTNNEED